MGNAFTPIPFGLLKRLFVLALILPSIVLLTAASKSPSSTTTTTPSPASTVAVPTVTGPVTGGKGVPTLLTATVDPPSSGT